MRCLASGRLISLAALTVSTVMTGRGLPAENEQLDRRDRSKPAIVLNTGGRTSTCDVLKFTPDGTELLGTGDDKCVTIYGVGGKTLSEKTRVLRWPAWREQRGAIFAMDISRDGKRVAVGGFGMANSDVAIFDRTKRDEDALVHLTTLRRDLNDKENYYAVMSIAYSPSGARLAVGTASGSVWVWKPGEQPVLLGKDEPINGTKFNRIRGIFFDGEDKLFTVGESGKIIRWWHDGNAWQHQDFFDLKSGGLRAAAFNPAKGLMVAGELGPVVRVVDLHARKQIEIALKEREFPYSVAVSEDGSQLAVGVGRSREGTASSLEDEFSIRLYDLRQDPPKETQRLPHSGRAEALAWKGNRLAVAGGDNHEVRLWDVQRPNDPPFVARGAGAGLWGVALSDDSRYLSFTDRRDPNTTDPNRRGTGDYRYFDLRRRRFERAAPEGVKTIAALDTFQGWRVQADAKISWQWSVIDPQGQSHPLNWNRDEDGRPTCYTFLKPTGGQPVRLAIGHYWGFSLFDLTPGREPRRVQLFTGHQGEVTAIAASEDQSWIVTASNDQTISGWNLKDWPTKSVLGATFTAGPTSVRVAKVDVGSPAWEMGLIENDEIVLLSVIVKQGDKERPKDVFIEGREGTPAEAKFLLETAKPGKEVYVTVRRAGHVDFDTLSTVRTRPLWRFLPAADGDWLLWMWQGSYYETRTNGDRLAGFLMNDPDESKGPSFFRLEQFRKQFERPKVINTLLNKNEVAPALELALGKNPVPINLGLKEPPPVMIELPTHEAKTAVKARLLATPRGGNIDFMPKTVELWINDFRAKTWDAQLKPFDQTFEIDPKVLRSGVNHLTLQAYNRLGGRSEYTTELNNPQPAKPRNLLSLGIAVNDYSASVVTATRDKFGNLRGAINDVTMLSNQWAGQKGNLFAVSPPVLKPNEQAARASVLAELDRLATEPPNPDDVLLIFLSGHGYFDEKPGPTPDDTISRFYFCCPNFDYSNPEKTGIDHETLYAKLAAIPCRKVVFLDACHAGEAAFNPVRSLTPGGQGPIIFAACSRTEQAYEHPTKENGIFTLTILRVLNEGFAEADTNHDGILDAQELIRAVEKQLPKMLSEAELKNVRQNPQFFPANPEKIALYRR